jgi:hypothetical protein
MMWPNSWSVHAGHPTIKSKAHQCDLGLSKLALHINAKAGKNEFTYCTFTRLIC